MTGGFTNAASMEGGIKAWRGLKAEGPPEAGMAFFSSAADAGELIGLAWLLEDGSRNFYDAVASMQSAPETARLFRSLAAAEEHHKESLRTLYRSVTSKEPDSAFPQGLAVATSDDGRMEGNVRVAEALGWAKGRSEQELLELSMALETDSYDLYIKMGRTVPGEAARTVFARLIDEEKEHLARMAELLDRVVERTAG